MLGSWKQVDMAVESPDKALLYLAVPLMISLFFQNLYSFANTIFVSWMGEQPLAAISLAVPLTYVALSLGKGVAMGSAVLIGYARGAGDHEQAERIGEVVLPLMIAVMALFLPLLLPGVCQSFYQLFGAATELAQEAYWFTFWLVVSFPVMGYAMAAEAMLMAHGDTVTPMKGMIWGNVVNFCLDPLLIFVLDFGLTGAGLATLAGQGTAAVYIGWRWAQRRHKWLSVRPAAAMMGYWRQISGQGAFITAGYLISPAGLMLMNGILAHWGAAAIGAWNMMSRLEMMVMLPVMGIGNGLAIFTSYNWGQGRFDRIRQGIKAFFCIAWCLTGLAAVGFALWPGELLGVFKPGGGVAELASHAVRASAAALVFLPVLFALNGLAQGLKKPIFLVITGFCYIIALRVPLAWVLGSSLGVSGVYWAHPAAAAGAAVVAAVLITRLLSKISQSGGVNDGSNMGA